MTETRQTFTGLSELEMVGWYVAIAVSTAIFFFGVSLLVAKYRRGRATSTATYPARRLWRTAGIVAGHRWIRRRDPVAGIGHLLIFYGFAGLFAGTLILAVQDDFARPVLGYVFWRGAFYLAYSFVLDLSGVALLAGLAVMAARRGLQRLPRLDYARPDREEDRRLYVIGDWVFLGALFFLLVTGFLLEALRIAQSDASFEAWSPVGWGGAQILKALGTGAEASAHHALWWIHGVVALTFVAAIPFTKALHMLVAPVNIALLDESPGQLAPLPLAAGPGEVGYGKITDLTWGQLVSLDACTRCGRCHEVCPATAGGYPLSPRDLVLDLREIAEGSLGIRSVLGVPPLYEPAGPLVNGTIRPETVWSCTQCMACVEVCPVGIEHVPIINQLRRRLLERGEGDSLLQATLTSIADTGNSFGEPRRNRARWTRELGFDIKDARSAAVDLLWFVGDYASFDPRNQRATRALARILDAAGVDFGLLFEAEEGAGCDVRRAGEEGLWTSLAEKNIATLRRCNFQRILTSDPHSFHTLRNEYPLHGAEWSVVHHSELLVELLASDRLEPLRMLDYRVTYHDPCTLGRYNSVYEPPRQVLERLGCELVEMPRNRENSFCCGGGGGRIWMKELGAAGVRRPSEQRIDEAVSLGGLDYFVVACPKDVTMYADAIKTSGHEGELELRELSELVLESLALPEPGP